MDRPEILTSPLAFGRLILFALLGIASLGSACDPATPPPAAPSQGLEAADALFEEIIERQLRANPTRATNLGDHRFDGAWPDFSPEGIRADAARIDQDIARLDALDRARLTIDQRVDLDILRNRLERQRFDHQVTRSFQHDPLTYVRTMGAGMDELMNRDFAPLDERATHLAMRLEGLPTLVQHATAHLRVGPVMKPHTEVAIRQLGGVRALVESESRSHFADASPAIRDRIERAIPGAVAAIADFGRVLERELLPTRATHPWRLGRESFARKLALHLQTDLPIDEIVVRARAAKAQIRADMARQARALHEPLMGVAADPGAPDDVVIRTVLEALADDHVTPEGLRDAAEENLARLAEFVRAENIIELDETQVLEVIWTPAHQRGVAIAGLDQPGPLEENKPGLPSFYLVQPLPDDWSDEVRESFLREYNVFMLEVLSIHEAIPGHFVQLYYGRREPSKVRRVYGNGTFIEGWAVYSEHVMIEHGYQGAGPAPDTPRPAHISEGLWKVKTTPELRALAIALHRNKFWLRSTVNAILDHEMHVRGMEMDDALRLLMDEAFQQEGEARGKWVRAQLTSTQLSSYFVGATAWLDLRQAAERRAGDDFDEAAFHGQALSHGAPPIQRLPELMGW